MRKAQLKNYLTAIDWQIDEMNQQIAKRDLEKRQREIADIYKKKQDEQ